VLAAAQQLFAEQGYAATTLAHIAEAAGLTEAALARMFHDRKRLFEALLAEVRSLILGAWESATAELTDPVARLRAVTEAYLACTSEHPEVFRALHRALAEDHDEIRPLLLAFYQDWETFVAGLISEGQQSGFFRRALDPRVGAWELIRTALAYTLLQPLGLPLYDNPDYLPQALECALHCLLKTDV
jgi:TetR/AcrR family acrAB operon transcriptional repressor/TetR/AcrR family transcriptional repressor of mexAB-oprM operon